MEQPAEEQQSEIFSSDVKAFCALAARIILRCLREGDERTLQILGLWKEQQQKGPDDESAA